MKSMTKNTKLALILAVATLITIISCLLYLEVSKLGFMEERIKLYTYNQNSEVDYQVFFKPENILYGDNSEDTGVYLTAFTDYIKAVFNYEFVGERSAEFIGNYNIVAVMEGYTEVDKQQKTLWKKDFVLVPNTDFNTSGEMVSIVKEFPLKLEQYNNFAKKIMTESKVISPVKLSVFMNVDLNAKTDKGSIVEKMSPFMIIPLNTDYFEIAKSEVQDKPGAIEETKKVQIPMNKTKVAAYGIILGILVITLLLLIFFIKGVVNDPFVSNLNKIFKKHGDRLVAINNEIAATSEKSFKAKSIDDLVRIADEIGQPIIYKYSPNHDDINQFYVFDDGSIYVLDLKESIEAVDIKAQLKKDKYKTTTL